MWITTCWQKDKFISGGAWFRLIAYYSVRIPPCSDKDYEKYRRELAGIYKLHLNTFEFISIKSLPVKSSGKIDYKKLNEMIGTNPIDVNDQVEYKTTQ